jgi:hypothetical protein
VRAGFTAPPPGRSSTWCWSGPTSLDKGFHQARADLQPERCFVVTPAAAVYPLADGVEVVGLAELAERLRAEG